MLGEHEKRLRAGGPVDGVYLALHGGSSGTGDDNPEGTLLERVRSIVGPGVPVIATLDLHANVSRKMVDNAFIPPSVAQNTKSGPYADIIAYGQSKMDARVMNVSVVSGFSLGDSVKNGMCVS